jgi:hypothetical protein
LDDPDSAQQLELNGVLQRDKNDEDLPIGIEAKSLRGNNREHAPPHAGSLIDPQRESSGTFTEIARYGVDG